MRELMEGVWTWARFSEEKGLDFNGLYLDDGNQALLVDPVAMSDEDAERLEARRKPGWIILTNKDHRRASSELRERFGARLMVSAADAPLLDITVDGEFRDGEILAGFLDVIALPALKSPGECAFHWPARKLLILGDALVGKVPGRLNLLPVEKVPDPRAAKQGMRRLLEKDFETVLVGDGTGIFVGARSAVEAALD